MSSSSDERQKAREQEVSNVSSLIDNRRARLRNSYKMSEADLREQAENAMDLINHFQAVQVDSTLYISGQIGFIPSTMQVTGKQNKNVTNLDFKTRVCLSPP